MTKFLVRDVLGFFCWIVAFVNSFLKNFELFNDSISGVFDLSVVKLHVVAFLDTLCLKLVVKRISVRKLRVILKKCLIILLTVKLKKFLSCKLSCEFFQYNKLTHTA